MTDVKKPVLTMPDDTTWEWVRWGEPRVGDYYLLSHGAEMHKRTNIQVDYKTDIYRPLTPPAPKKEKPPTLKELINDNIDVGSCVRELRKQGWQQTPNYFLRLHNAALPVYSGIGCAIRYLKCGDLKSAMKTLQRSLNLLDGVSDE